MGLEWNVNTQSPTVSSYWKEKRIFQRFKYRHTKVAQRFWAWQQSFIHWIKTGRRIRFLYWFRQYSALAVVISSAFAVTGTNIASNSSKSLPGLIFGGEVAVGQENMPNHFAQVVVNKENITSSPAAKASLAPDASSTDMSSTSNISPSANQFVVAAQQSPVLKDPEEDGGVKIYTVVNGDTVSDIATRNHITVNTILWANDMSNVDSIQPGDKIFILPVAGLTYTVKDSDTIESVASQFTADGDKIIAYNNLPANGRLEKGESIIIPDGRRAAPPTQTTGTGITRRQYVDTSQTDLALDLSGSKKLSSANAGEGHRFPYGYCTWYVAQKRYIPWGGNAGSWLFNAKSLGYKTGRAPRAGAIMVTTESAAYGHVALVESVNGNTLTVSEMNFNAWGKTNRRTLQVADRAIKGFIY